MSPRTPGRPGRRALAIPAVLVPAAIVAAVVLIPNSAVGAVDLPDKTPKELIEFAEASDVDQLSGTIEQTSELGLPDLGALTGDAAGRADDDDADADAADVDDLLELVTGSYAANVYLDGERGRLQVLDRLAERNVYVDGESGFAWFVDSESKTATKLTVPEGTDLEQLEADAEARADDARAEAEQRYEAETGQQLPTPEAMLDQALARLDETTEVTVGTDGRVAGRDVYELVLEPRSDDTLVGSIRFAIDGENGAALAASVVARGADDPAFRVTFTEVSFSAPDASTLNFEPASDIAVTEKEIEIPTADQLAEWRAKAEAKRAEPDGTPEAVAPTVYGEGWSAVVELPATAADGTSLLNGLTAEQRQTLDTVTTPVDGGRVFETSLATVLITDDGRVLAGAVPADRLLEAAASGR